ncbi:DNA mismatch repair protein PMS2, partial [Tremellales sp. Uapishka_1]
MAASIKAIDNDSVHRIHAGQVVLELQAAIKELVENSLDAGATSIDVRIKEQGLESIEVVDNGSGIGEADWPNIGLKHHTSKLPSLSDLPQITTFGFRGEALSSLCALCETVTVMTATKETAPMGTVIKLGRDGRVVDASGKGARQRGTTITLTGLFKPLPVRRKEFERNSKREFAKALTLLTAYALVPSSVLSEGNGKGVRLKVESIGGAKAAKRSTLLATDGKGSLRAAIISVWGTKALDNAVDVNLELEVHVDKGMARREGLDDGSQTVKVVGVISSASWGLGRTSPDRQFFYINGRPCNLPKIAKAINEVYKSFNTHQVPLAVLDFLIPPESVDINVSPDKRTIFVHSEANLIEALRSTLETFFQPTRSTYVVAKMTQPTLDHQLSQKPDLVPSSSDVRRKEGDPTFDDAGEEDDEDEHEEDEELEEEEDGGEEGHQGEQSRSLRAQEKEEDEDELDIDNDSLIVPLPRPTRNRFRSPERGVATSVASTSKRPVTGVSTQARPSHREIQQTINTTSASWSPKRNSRNGKSVGTGKEARGALREKLKVFASQGGTVLGKKLDSEEEEEVNDGEIEEDAVMMKEGGPVGIEGDTEMEEDAGEGTPLGNGEDEEDDRREEEGGAAWDEEDSAIPSRMAIPPSKRSRQYDQPATQIRDGEDDVEVGQADEEEEEALTQGLNPTALKSKSSTSSNVGDPIVNMSAPSPTPELVDSPPRLVERNSGYRDEIQSSNPLGEIVLRFDLPRLRSRYASQSARHVAHPKRAPRNAFTAVKEGAVVDAAGIGNKDSALAEEALARVISKADFERMEVLGQFNKGFIIARLRNEEGKSASDDLFIVDQHASDEKYNFETLQQTTVIKAQSLIMPKALQLTSGDEIVAMENIDVLKSNGFEVGIDEDKPPGRGERIKLLAMPVSKETTFDFKGNYRDLGITNATDVDTDLEQLLHLLSDGARPAGQMVRCHKARAMFAMRACRRSVMIGKALTKNQMTQVEMHRTTRRHRIDSRGESRSSLRGESAPSGYHAKARYLDSTVESGIWSVCIYISGSVAGGGIEWSSEFTRRDVDSLISLLYIARQLAEEQERRKSIGGLRQDALSDSDSEDERSRRPPSYPRHDSLVDTSLCEIPMPSITTAYQPTHTHSQFGQPLRSPYRPLQGLPVQQSPLAADFSPATDASVPPNTNLDSVLSRELALHILRLYFEHVPKSYVPVPPEGVRRLSDKCLKACYAVTIREMNDASVDLIIIKYLVFVVHNKHGHVGLEAATFGEAQYLAISLGLHREDTYYGLNPIEAERRRRVFFLIYNADKFEAASRAKPVLLRSDEFMGPEATNFPAEIDDDSITVHGYSPPSAGSIPVITGFNILTRLVSILGDILVHERDTRRRPPQSPEDILVSLRQIRQLQHRIRSIADNLSRPFQLDSSGSDSLPGPGWENEIRDQLDLFFASASNARETTQDGYLVLKANIHVTLAMTRLRLILYREDLLNRSGQPGTPSRNGEHRVIQQRDEGDGVGTPAAELVATDLGENLDWRLSVYQDLFKAVHGIPIQALAANGPSLVTKIRVVAVTLLDALPAEEVGDENVQGIAAYLLDFLSIMGSIEQQFAD